jgi:hypothetical protein
MIRHAGVAWRKGHGSNVAPRTKKRRSFGRRRRAHLECDKGIKNQELRQQLRLGSKRISGGFTGRLSDIVKGIAGSSVGMRKMSVRTLWRGQPPPKPKKKLHTE